MSHSDVDAIWHSIVVVINNAINYADRETITFRPYNDRPSRAVIASNNGNGCVMFYVGRDISAEIEEAGCSTLEDMGMDNAPDGISVWEGQYHIWAEDECPLEGSFRAPTDSEWKAIQENRCPWNPNEWMLLCGKCSEGLTKHSDRYVGLCSECR